MRRGEVWTAATGSGYGGKPRPVVILQDDRFDTTESITVCPLTSDPTEAAYVRPVVAPDSHNGLRELSRLMADKIMTVPRAKMGYQVGELRATDVAALNRAVMLFLGLAEV